MFFWDNKKQKPVENCPSCSSAFIVNKGADCLTTCPAKKLEIKHKKIVKKMVTYCFFNNKKPKVLFPPKKTLLDERRIIKWGWTFDFKQVINIPWYTLRRKEFFDTVAHELGHITAYEKLFKLSERKIIHDFKNLCLEYNSFHSRLTSAELKRYYIRYQKTIDKYDGWEGHDYNPWYKEYLKFHRKLVNSPFVKYAYGNTEPHSYGFDKNGKGKYGPQK